MNRLPVRVTRCEPAAPDFERVRDAVGIYAAFGPEPVPPGSTGWLAFRGDQPVARATTRMTSALQGVAGTIGLIGHYETLDAEAGVEVLRAAARALANDGATRVVGPMNGSTWARYRLALRPGSGDDADAEASGSETSLEDPPPFLAEPWNPPSYSLDFKAAGFVVAARYESRVDESLESEALDADALAQSVSAAGFRVRPLDLSRFDEELTALYELSLATFANNLYYSPIGKAAFQAQYQKARPLIDPELVLIAENAAGAPVAFQFAFVDPLTPAGAPRRVVVKTVATAPAARGKGLGGAMLDRIRRRARAAGCHSIVHALMHVENFSMRMSARHESRLFRRYALYRWAP